MRRIPRVVCTGRAYTATLYGIILYHANFVKSIAFSHNFKFVHNAFLDKLKGWTGCPAFFSLPCFLPGRLTAAHCGDKLEALQKK